ncbi:restriction endonuclease subunit S [Sinorhizobium medicae]|uniref:restriction endonuclease subunit S n=1 Tax=Sinorhizobium medicae TaxID=110321 RepID=UPI00308C18C0|nr:restriction endonuclease subunit S [Sinorhizobium medicae]
MVMALSARMAASGHAVAAPGAPNGYKQTEVGIIPEDWEVYRLGDLFEITSSKRVFKSEWKSDGVPFYRAREIALLSERGFVDNELFISREMYDAFQRSYGVPQPGDLLVTGVGTLGKVYVVPDKGEFYFKDGNIIWFKINNAVSSFFLRQLYLIPAIINQIFDGAAGTTVGTYTISAAKKTVVPFPPTQAEQETIADALLDADALVKSLESLIAKKIAIKQGAMQELLTGRQRLPGFKAPWGERSLFQLAGCQKERFNDGDWVESEHIIESGIRLIQTGNIGIGEFVESESKKYISEVSFKALRCKEVRTGDLLISRLADPAGRACILPEIGEDKVITSVDVTIFRPLKDEADECFLKQIFCTSDWFQSVSDRSGGTTHKRISRGALGAIKIRVPSVSEQAAIASVLKEMDSEIASLQSKLKKAHLVKQGMMQQLLTGRVRLI